MRLFDRLRVEDDADFTRLVVVRLLPLQVLWPLLEEEGRPLSSLIVEVGLSGAVAVS